MIMRRSSWKFLVMGAAVLALVSTGCDNGLTENPKKDKKKDRSYDSSINSTIPTDVESTDELELDSRSVTASGSSGDAEVNIADGAQGVMVNQPVEADFFGGIDSSEVNTANFYLVNADTNQAVPVRLSQEGSTVIMIPQIRMQPNTAYTAVLKDKTVTYTTDDLDYGLYWYGKYGRCEKYLAGYDNAFYDAGNKTVIYAHGWQAGAVTQTDAYGRENYGYEMFFWAEDDFGTSDQYNGLRKWTNHDWIDKGWNTGMVYWNQFADEPTMADENVGGVHDAEAKIWSFDGWRGSRYRTLDSSGNPLYREWDRNVSFNGQDYQASSVAEMLYIPVQHALEQNYSGNIRFVGHSLGNQLATRLAFMAYQDGIAADRLALLDPAWTADAKDYLPSDGYGDWVGERVRHFIFEMMDAQDLAVEIYHTTGMNIGVPVMDDNKPLTKEVCDVFMGPWYYSGDQLDGKHVCVRHSYFWSMEFEPPVECHISWWRRTPTGETGASASASTSRIREMMTTEHEWTQVEGRYTPSPEDDWLEKKTKDDDWFTLW